MKAWRLEPFNGVDPWEADIRAWVERQTSDEVPDNWRTANVLWEDAAGWLSRHAVLMCRAVHVFMRRVYKRRRGERDEWPTFEETMGRSTLSNFGACMMAMWLLDSVLPADCRILVGLAERADGEEIVPVVLVMEAGIMIIDPSGKVCGWWAKRLGKVKGWSVHRLFDITGSYSLNEVTVDEDEVQKRREQK